MLLAAAMLTCTDASMAARIALVIGNGTYTDLGVLANPVNDAEAIARTLREIGYSVRIATNLDGKTFRREISQFSRQSERAEAALVYYAGHGVQINGENYLLPVDMEIPSDESEIRLSGIKVDDTIASLKSNLRIVFLDACRENPVLSRSLSRGRGTTVSSGLAPVRSAPAEGSKSGGIFIAYATDSGNVAADGSSEHSPFTDALLKHLKKPISLDDMFSLVTRDVRQSTNNAQRPYKYASLDSIFCIVPGCASISSQRQEAASREDRINLATMLPSGAAQTNRSSASAIVSLKPLLSGGFSEVRISESDLPFSHTPNKRWIHVDRTKDGLFSYLPESIRIQSGRVIAKVRMQPIRFARIENREIPSKDEPVIIDETRALDCGKRAYGVAEYEAFTSSGVRSSWKVYGDPRVIETSTEFEVGSVFDEIQRLLCNPAYAGALITPAAMRSEDWLAVGNFSSPPAKISVLPTSISKDKEFAIALVRTELVEPLRHTTDVFSFSNELEIVKINCSTRENSILLIEYIDNDGYPQYKYPILKPEIKAPEDNSVFSNLHRLVCISLK